MTRANATGVPSKNEDGSLQTGRILAQRQNQNGATWGKVYEVKAGVGGSVDCEAKDTRDPRRSLKLQVTRAEGDEFFWTDSVKWPRLNYPRVPSMTCGLSLEGDLRKQHYAHPDEVLALNAIRTPWAVSRPVVEPFRQRRGKATRGLGFKEVWLVGWNEALTERLDT